MIVKVNPHKIELEKEEAVNEKEIDISRCHFEFSDEITSDYVKEAFFTFKGQTYKVIIQDDECAFPSEVLEEKGDVELGVVAYKVENEQEIKRYNPSPAYFNTWVGSFKEKYENSEEVTPSDKEQIEQMLSNISLSITKEGKVATISFTNTEGTTQTETLEDGKSLEFNWQGTSLGIRQEGDLVYQYVDLQGRQGEPGAIKFEIVATLPTENIKMDTIYLVAITPDEEDNNYAEYIYVNGSWEELGKIGVHVDLSNYYTKQETDALIPDLTDYVKNTDYASWGKGGVVKIDYANFGILIDEDGYVKPTNLNFVDYSSKGSTFFIGKGTLENVIAGKGLVSDYDYATNNKGGVIKGNVNGFQVQSNGTPYAETRTYASYSSGGNALFVSKGTLENVIAGKGLTTKAYVDGLVGDIESILETLDIGSGV